MDCRPVTRWGLILDYYPFILQSRALYDRKNEILYELREFSCRPLRREQSQHSVT